jgi:hypothetical protein
MDQDSESEVAISLSSSSVPAGEFHDEEPEDILSRVRASKSTTNTASVAQSGSEGAAFSGKVGVRKTAQVRAVI